jgi:hypothetical protein
MIEWHNLRTMSNLKPSFSHVRARPPSLSFFSRTVTAQPSFAREQAADKPAKPAPITTARPRCSVIRPAAGMCPTIQKFDKLGGQIFKDFEDLQDDPDQRCVTHVVMSRRPRFQSDRTF